MLITMLMMMTNCSLQFQIIIGVSQNDIYPARNQQFIPETNRSHFLR